MMKKNKNFKFAQKYELRRQKFHAFETTKKEFFWTQSKYAYNIMFFTLHVDLRFHRLSRKIIQYYLIFWHKNCLKDQFQRKTGFIFLFYCPTVSLETDK